MVGEAGIMEDSWAKGSSFLSREKGSGTLPAILGLTDLT